jgi:lipopolysaccharide/colanic/teichoic acid biosynthesis glycosyltransferase
MSKSGRTLFRIIDVSLSVIVLLFSLPIFIITAIAVKLDSKGPVFFIHERTGYRGKKFKMIKFRGMVDNALEIGPELTQKNDPRITKVGKILRRTSLDEIPQFINVLKGEMSIVGPRPEIASITDNYSEEQREVFNFKPGITGISQINGRQMLSPEKRIKMEVDYYRRATFSSNLKILLRTFKVVLSNEGNL